MFSTLQTFFVFFYMRVVEQHSFLRLPFPIRTSFIRTVYRVCIYIYITYANSKHLHTPLASVTVGA